MAQLSAGMSVQYGQVNDRLMTTPPTSWTDIPDITSVPAMGGNISTHDVTTIYNTNKVYIEGLPDVGGTLGFAANFTKELYDEVESIRALQDSGSKANPPKYMAFSVTYPAPLSKRVWFLGTCAPVASDEAGVDAPLTCTVNITPSSDFKWTDYLGASSELPTAFTSPSTGSRYK